MTTIAYKDGVMACDSLMSGKYNQYSNIVCRKIYRLPNGLVGISGDANEAYFNDDWIESIQTSADVLAAVESVATDVDEATYVFMFVFNDNLDAYYHAEIDEGNFSGMHKCDIVQGFGAAIGTGLEIAMTAMYLGCTAEEAILTASVFDLRTDDRVQSYVL